MPDLSDGESIEVKGSGAKPYLVRNVRGAYSCTCPAWRNQSAPSDRRTCKHIRRLRGEAAEEARVGALRPQAPDGAGAQPPEILLAEVWSEAIDPTGWWMSEKLDGIRACWDGRELRTRRGNPVAAPEWFLAALPGIRLDGELWAGRGSFQRTAGIVRGRRDEVAWRDVRYVVFDSPDGERPFEDRLAAVRAAIGDSGGFLIAHPHERCMGVDHLRASLAHVESLGGEGLMLRQPGSRHEPGRSRTLLKVKSFEDDEAVVEAHEPGEGRFEGVLGALRVIRKDGCRFSLGTGFTDAERRIPPQVGATVLFRHQGLTDAGVPRFPVFVRQVDVGD
jgi:DNA ligase-1